MVQRAALIAVVVLVGAPALLRAEAPARLERLEARLPDTDTLEVDLRAPELTAKTGQVPTHSLALGGVLLPASGPATIGEDERGRFVRLRVRLRDVPEAVLDLPVENLPVAWFGRIGRREPAVKGTVDLGRNADLELSDEVRRRFARLGPVTIAPSLSTVGFHALLELYNPFSFDLVVSAMDYRMAIGGQQVLASRRPGFRLRPGQRSDVAIEDQVELAQLAAALGNLLGRRTARLDGEVVVRTPTGERVFPFEISTSP